MSYSYPPDGTQGAAQYDFITELSPGVWKVCRKADRIEYLAHDITDKLTTNPSLPIESSGTDLHYLLRSEKTNLLKDLKYILTHENLVSLVDWIEILKSNAGGTPVSQHFAVWDYCNAGNLGNLLVREQIDWGIKNRPINDSEWEKESVKDEPPFGDDFSDDYREMPEGEDVKTQFLPESLCWHVALSVLKALAWLHDGCKDVGFIRDSGKLATVPDRDWEPILHRNLTPRNIFFEYPVRGETYGRCKLGNYGSLSISGHIETERSVGKALAPPRGTAFQSLEELVRLDAQYGYSYPQRDDQPYTVMSEWRAFGEIMQAMMVQPYMVNHLAMIRQQSVMENLKAADYSTSLKNIVVMLMEFVPGAAKPDGEGHFPTQFVTGDLYMTTFKEFIRWKNSNDPDAREMVIRDVLFDKQREEDADRLRKNKEAADETQAVLRKQDDLFPKKNPLPGDPEKEWNSDDDEIVTDDDW